MRTALLILVLAPLLAKAQADREGTKDHPAIRRWPGSVITDNQQGEFAEQEFKFPISDSESKKVEGKYLLNIYRLPSAVTCAKVAKGYEINFKAQLLTTHTGVQPPAPDLQWADGKWVSAEGNGKSGGQLFVTIACPADNFEGPELFMWVLDNQKMQPPVAVDAAAMAERIKKFGKVALYTVNFPAGKATLGPGADKTLEQIATLLKDKADWTLRIDVHSDNAGSAKTNLALSKKRADAVKAQLIAKGADEARLLSDGFGDKKPLSPNTSDVGRANNRRVELTKIQVSPDGEP